MSSMIGEHHLVSEVTEWSMGSAQVTFQEMGSFIIGTRIGSWFDQLQEVKWGKEQKWIIYLVEDAGIRK